MRSISMATAITVGVFTIGPMLMLACSAAPATDTGAGESATTGSSSGSSSGGSSSGSTSGSSSGSTSGSSSGGSSSGSTSSSSSSGSVPALSAADQACVAKDSDSCYDCCYANHPSGSDLYDAVWSACMCTASTCGTQCAQTDCSDDDDAGTSVTGDACDTCEDKFNPEDGTGSCDKPITDGCLGNADCAAFYACQDACP